MASVKYLFCAFLAFGAAAPGVGAPAAEPVTIGIMVNSPPWPSGDFLRETVRYLQWKLPKTEFRIDYFTPKELKEAIQKQSVDFFAANPALLSSYGKEGLRILTTMVSREAPDPDAGSAGAVLVRKDSVLKSLSDLKGKRVATSSADDFSSYIPLLGRIAESGENPEKFFKEVLFEGPTEARRALDRVRKGEADAAIVRAGYLEDRILTAGSADSGYRVLTLEKPPHETFKFDRSTDLFPNLVFGATGAASQNQIREVLAVLLAKPTNAWGQKWTVTPNFEKIDSLLKSLKIGPYEYLRSWSLQRIWREFWPFLLLTAFGIAFLLLHSVLAERKVRRRTAQLVTALETQKRSQEEIRRQAKKIEDLEKSGIVGQLSTLTAHEMKNNLGSIIHLSHAMRQRIEDAMCEGAMDEEALSALEEKLVLMDEQAKKGSQIIDHIRSYAKKSQEAPELLDLAHIIRDTAESFAKVKGWKHPIELDLASGLKLTGRKLEIELLLLNLLKNASEACRNVPKPKVSCALEKIKNDIFLTVKDNGLPVSEEKFKEIKSFSAKSTKSDGFGLGLGIIRTLAESHRGSLSVERIPRGGLAFKVRFPAAEEPL